MARRGVYEPVHCRLLPHVTVCQRHHLWIGPPARDLDDQIDIRNNTRVFEAARRHRELVRTYGTYRCTMAMRDARHILIYWANAEQSAAAPILDNTLSAQIDAYPDLLGVAAVLAAHSDPLQQHLIKDGIAWPARLVTEINQLTGHTHTDISPIEQWVHNQRLIAAKRGS
jgi:hypothetical protein